MMLIYLAKPSTVRSSQIFLYHSLRLWFFVYFLLNLYLINSMDRILSYLPETVHIRVGYDNEPQYYGDHPGVEWVYYEIPKIWLKHG